MELIERLEALAAKATPSPWKSSNYRPHHLLQRDPNESTYEIGDNNFMCLASFDEVPDVVFVAALRNAFPELAAHIKAQAAEIERLDTLCGAHRHSQRLAIDRIAELKAALKEQDK